VPSSDDGPGGGRFKKKAVIPRLKISIFLKSSRRGAQALEGNPSSPSGPYFMTRAEFQGLVFLDPAWCPRPALYDWVVRFHSWANPPQRRFFGRLQRRPESKPVRANVRPTVGLNKPAPDGIGKTTAVRRPRKRCALLKDFRRRFLRRPTFFPKVYFRIN